MSSKRCFIWICDKGYEPAGNPAVHNHCAVNLALSNPPSSMFVDLTHSRGAVNLA